MAQIPTTSGPNKRKKSVGDRRYARTSAPTEEAKFFFTDDCYNKYLATVLKLVTPLKCWDLQVLQSEPLTNLFEILEHFKLVKFVCFSDNCYPRLVRMFYANLGVVPGTLSGYVMNKRIVLNIATMTELFDMDGAPPKILGKDHPAYCREEALKLLFTNQKDKDYMSSGKFLPPACQ